MGGQGAGGQTDRQEGHHHAPAGGRGELSEHEAEAGVESGGELEPWTGRGGASRDGVAVLRGWSGVAPSSAPVWCDFFTMSSIPCNNCPVAASY